MKNKLSTILKWAGYSFSILLMAVMLVVFLLRFSFVQRQLIGPAEDAVGTLLDTKVEIGGVFIEFPMRAKLDGLRVYDKQNEVMVSLRSLKISLLSVPIWRLATGTGGNTFEIGASRVDLVEPHFFLYKQRRDSAMNISFLLASDPDKPPSEKKFAFEFPRINLIDGSFTFVDSTKSDSLLKLRETLNLANIQAKKIQGQLSFHMDDHTNTKVELLHLEARDAHSGMAVDTFRTEFWAWSGVYHAEMDTNRPFIMARDLVLRSGKTRLDADALLFDEDFQHLTDTTVDEILHLRLRPSSLDFSAINYFVEGGLPLSGVVNAKGIFEGNLSELRSDRVELAYLDSTRITTSLDLQDFTKPDQLYMRLKLEKSKISYEELKKLLPDVEIPLAGVIEVEGGLRGDLSYLKSRDLFVSYGKQTQMRLAFSLFDYTQTENLFITADFENSLVNIEEIHRMLPSVSIPEAFYTFGQAKVNGDFVGGLNDFVVKADFLTQLGNLRTNLQVKMPPKTPDLYYKGDLTTENLNYDAVAVSDVLKSSRLNFTGNIEGSGTEFEKMNISLDGKITHSDLFGYDIDTLAARDFVIKDRKIMGEVMLRDAQGNASASIELNLGDKHSYELKGDIASVDLNHYGVELDSFPLLMTSIINVKLEGDSLEDLNGNAKFYQLNFERPQLKRNLRIRNLNIRTFDNTPVSKNINVNSSIADVVLKGNFSYDRGIQLFKRLAYEAELFYKNDDSLITAYYAEKVPDSTDAEIDWSIKPRRQFNEVLSFVDQSLWVSDSTWFHGHFVGGEVDQVEVNFYSDSMNVSGIGLKNNSLTLDVNKNGSRNDELIGAGDLQIGELYVNENLSFEKVRFEPVQHNNEIEYWISGSQEGYDNEFRFKAITEFFGNGISTRINPSISKIQLQDQLWVIDQQNEIFITGNRIEFYDLRVTSGQQVISLNGVLAKEEWKPGITDPKDLGLHINVNNLDIESITDIYHLSMPLSGNIDSLYVHVFDGLDEPRVTAIGHVEDFSYAAVDSLELFLRGNWQDTKRSNLANFRTQVHYQEQEVLALKGRYNFLDTLNPIDITSEASNLPLNFVEPFVEDYVKIPSGKVELDSFRVRGNMSKLDVRGVGHFKNTEFFVNYLGTSFRLSDKTSIRFDNDRILFPKITILDTAGHTALLDGNIRHNGLEEFFFDLNVNEIDNFLFMNTQRTDTSLFYGTVFIKEGVAYIQGTDKQIEVTAFVESGKNSVLSIPLEDYTTADRPDYVTFLDESGEVKVRKDVDLSGFKLDLNVVATPDAKVRLIFDEKVGDVIEAQGEGNLSMQITDDGDFSMFGNYEISKGEYLFTTYNVYNKKFKVTPGGKITWTGDPYEANLDLEATHLVKANVGDLLGDDANTTRVPVNIIMHLTGPLSSPIIKLKLNADQAEDISGLGDYFRNIQGDEQELNKQVVSLLIFKRFAPSHSGLGNGAGIASSGLTSSLGELISNQVNNWLSQAFNDQFGVEFTTTSANEVDLELRASLFDDKVTIERNGTLIGNNTGQVSIGDISVLIKLLPIDRSKTDSNFVADPDKGQLVVELFNRESANMTTTRNSYTTGAGIFYKKDFDRFSELIRRKPVRKPKPDTTQTDSTKGIEFVQPEE